MLASLLSPSLRLAGPWLLGLGPTFIFPTPTNANLGQRKWQVGPGAVIGYLDEHFIVEAFLQQWFSVAGPGSKDIPVNSTCSTLPITFFRGAGCRHLTEHAGGLGGPQRQHGDLPGGTQCREGSEVWPASD